MLLTKGDAMISAKVVLAPIHKPPGLQPDAPQFIESP